MVLDILSHFYRFLNFSHLHSVIYFHNALVVGRIFLSVIYFHTAIFDGCIYFLSFTFIPPYWTVAHLLSAIYFPRKPPLWPIVFFFFFFTFSILFPFTPLDLV